MKNIGEERHSQIIAERATAQEKRTYRESIVVSLNIKRNVLVRAARAARVGGTKVTD